MAAACMDAHGRVRRRAYDRTGRGVRPHWRCREDVADPRGRSCDFLNTRDRNSLARGSGARLSLAGPVASSRHDVESYCLVSGRSGCGGVTIRVLEQSAFLARSAARRSRPILSRPAKLASRRHSALRLSHSMVPGPGKTAPHPEDANRLGARTLSDHTSRQITAEQRHGLFLRSALELSGGPVEVFSPTDTSAISTSLSWTPLRTTLRGCTRLTKGVGGAFWVAGPQWTGSAPAGVTVFRSSTNDVWMLGRIVVEGPTGRLPRGHRDSRSGSKPLATPHPKIVRSEVHQFGGSRKLPS